MSETTAPTNPYAEADPSLAPGTVHAGFVVERVEPLPELRGQAYVMRHGGCGARLMWVACPDENRAFSIAFKTPPADDTGVFHIIEHSVLDGSERFPTKEPFVHLLKSSMQTFLNALTFPDKTMYPVSSTNVRDLENLMDVYLDAVLHPNIYDHPRIFEQEGWHLEVEGAGDDRRLSYNGVVLNEMKGALSDPDEVLYETTCRRLFPDTCYGHDSGGNPRAIPQLTYEGFLDAHARHYRPSNAYVMLYGDLDCERELAFVAERLEAAEERGAGAPNPLGRQEPIACDPLRVEMATAPENACVGVSYVTDRNDRTSTLALAVLSDALMGSNQTPLKRRLLEEGLGDDVVCMLADGTLQPMLMFELKGAREGVADRFRALLEDECRALVEGGVPRDMLEASLSRLEFVLREQDYGSYSPGVYLAMNALSSWLYDDARTCEYLRYEDALAELRRGLDEGLFESLLDEVVCRSRHSALVEVVPGGEGTSGEEAEELARLRAGMGEAELDAIAREVEALRAEQQAPDPEEAVASLPRLTVADVGEAPAGDSSVRLEAPAPCWRNDVETHGIAYATAYFGLDCVRWEELPYVSVLASVLGKLATARRSAAELDVLCGRELGDLSFSCTARPDTADRSLVRPMLVVGASALSDRVTSAATIPQEVWSTSDLSDAGSIRDTLQQVRVRMEQAFMGAGHSAAMARAASHLSPATRVGEQMAGVDFYLFLRDLLEHYDERSAELSERLAGLARRIFSEGNVELSVTGSARDAEAWLEAAGDLSLAAGPAPAVLEIPRPEPRDEAFAVPGDVCFVGCAMDLAGLADEVDGAWRVLSRVVSYDYLWDRVRKEGGAYGCGMRARREGIALMYSYRDPAVDPTLASFDATASWLAGWEPTEEDLEGYKISAVAGLDAPVSARARGRRLDADRICRRPEGWRRRLRSQMLSCTLDDLRERGRALAELGARRVTCAFGGREILEASHAGLELVDLMPTDARADA